MGILIRSLAFVNGFVIGGLIGAALLVQFGAPATELLSVVKLAAVGAFVGSIFAGFKWLAGISGGITGGLLAVGFAILGVPPVPGLDEWVAKYLIVAIVIPLLPTVGLS